MSQTLIRLVGRQIGPASRSLICRPMASAAATGDKTANDNKATLAQLVRMEETLNVVLPKFFSAPHPYNLYTRNLILIDNIRGVRVEGLSRYALYILSIKLYHSVRYTSTKLELLNLVKVPEESCIKVRWRVVTKPGLVQFALFFWKYHSTENWKDGISTVHLNSEGKIYCHVCDNIDLEADTVKKEKSSIKNTLVNRGLNVNIKRTIVM